MIGAIYTLVLIGTPDLDKCLSHYPQSYSRVGLVHAFRPLNAPEVRELLLRWKPAEVDLPIESLADEEALTDIARITSGNFRLQPMQQMEVARLVEINNLTKVTYPVVEAARESFDIGEG